MRLGSPQPLYSSLMSAVKAQSWLGVIAYLWTFEETQSVEFEQDQDTGNTTLHEAILTGHFEIATHLLRWLVRNRQLEHALALQNHRGETVWHMAFQSQAVDMIDAITDACTQSLRLSKLESTPIREEFAATVPSNFGVNTRDQQGKTALEYLFGETGNLEIIAQLLLDPSFRIDSQPFLNLWDPAEPTPASSREWPSQFKQGLLNLLFLQAIKEGDKETAVALLAHGAVLTFNTAEI